ncbi:MAG: hypothetical protein AB7F19_02150 [Candidatus Babeliales bacterium]
MNKKIVFLLSAAFVFCAVYAMQESSGGVRGGKWAGLKLIPTRRSQQMSSEKSKDATAQNGKENQAVEDISSKPTVEAEEPKTEISEALASGTTEQTQESAAAE